MKTYISELEKDKPFNPKLKQWQGFPVMPGKVPFLGHAHRISKNALEEFREAEAQCGPFFWIYYGNSFPILQVMGEEGLAILQNKFTDSSHLRKQMGLISGDAMNTFDGAQHRRARGASAGAFTPKGLGRAQVGQFTYDTIQDYIVDWPAKGEVAVFDGTRKIALEVIFRILGIASAELDEWRPPYGNFMLGLIPLKLELPGLPAWRCRRARVWLEDKMSKVIEEVRASGDQDSLVGAMIHGRDENGSGLPERELLHNLLGLGFAGSETTAAVMAWMLLKLADEPKAWERLCDEANALDSVPLSFAELSAKVPYAEALCRETLRLYPPAPFEMRYVHTPFELMGREIPADINIGISLLHISRNPERYPDPDRWLPERWIGLDRKITPIENCQFGGGPHMCLGYHVALLEGTLFTVQIARELSRQGLVPKVKGPWLPPTYLPFMQPSVKPTVAFVKP